MRFRFFRPRPELQRFIESIWAFESPNGIPAISSRFVAPNGCPKLTFLYDNSLMHVERDRTTVSSPERLYFVGNKDSSRQLQSTSHRLGCIGFEFRPHGAFPIFGVANR